VNVTALKVKRILNCDRFILMAGEQVVLLNFLAAWRDAIGLLAYRQAGSLQVGLPKCLRTLGLPARSRFGKGRLSLLSLATGSPRGEFVLSLIKTFPRLYHWMQVIKACRAQIKFEHLH
jgi:hypothetical protein